MTPEELLTRYLGDITVFEQFLKSGRRSKKYDGLGTFHSDFFQSAAYARILETLSEDSGPFPPLLLIIYS